MPPLNPFEKFLDKLYHHGLEYFRRYHGPYRARVVNNRDPAKLGRIIVECVRAKFSGDNANWVYPMMMGAGPQAGVFWPPEEGDHVYVFFENGDPLKPTSYLGGWFATGELSDEFDPAADGRPKRRGFRTPGGHSVSLDDTDGSEKIRIRHKDGTLVEWTDSGQVKIGKEGGSFESLVRGESLKKWAETHTHPHPWGPTGPPVQPFTPDILSKDTKTS